MGMLLFVFRKSRFFEPRDKNSYVSVFRKKTAVHLKQKHSEVGKVTSTLVGVSHLQLVLAFLVFIYRSMCTSDNVSPNVTTSKHSRSIIKTPKEKGTSKKCRAGAVLHADAFLVTSRNEERPR
jgi:hypothetical protein